MVCAKFGTIVMANNDLARGGGTYETPYIPFEKVPPLYLYLFPFFVSTSPSLQFELLYIEDLSV